MARSDPEKLAQALRANLRRRKGPAGRNTAGEGHGSQPSQDPPQAPEKPQEKSG